MSSSSLLLLSKNVKCSVAAEHSLRHISFDIILNVIKYYNSLTSRKTSVRAGSQSVAAVASASLPQAAPTSLLRRQPSVPDTADCQPKASVRALMLRYSSVLVLFGLLASSAATLHSRQSLGRYLSSSDQYKMRRNMGKRLHTRLVALSSLTGTAAINIETQVTII